MKTPNSPQKNTLVSAWSWALAPTRLQDVRGLAADGSSETQGLLKMNDSLCPGFGRALKLIQPKHARSLT